MKEEKFYEKVKDICLFKTTEGKFLTMEELTKEKKQVRYTTDATAQAAYISMAKNEGYEVIILDEEIDNNFISFLEFKYQDIKFKRVDSEISGEDSDEETMKKLREFFRASVGDDKLTVYAKAMGKTSMPALIRESEENRRMQEMRKQYEQFARMTAKDGEDPYAKLDEMFPLIQEFIVNTDSPVISKLTAMKEMGTKDEEAKRLAQHIYDQAKLAHGSLDSEGLQRFLAYNSELLGNMLDK